jgi:hypothetical protein
VVKFDLLEEIYKNNKDIFVDLRSEKEKRKL